MRDVTVNAMIQRWAIEKDYVEQVYKTALSIYDFVVNSWDISDELLKNALLWSAKLHEIGLSIGHDGYQKHGAYMVANADMAGFTRREQLLLSALILGHRGKFPSNAFESLPSSLVTPAKRLVVILRLAVLFHRGRHFDIEQIDYVEADGKGINVVCQTKFLKRNPLTNMDLKEEQSRLKSAGIKLEFE